MPSSESEGRCIGTWEGEGVESCGCKRLGIPKTVELENGVGPLTLEAGGRRGPALPIDNAVSRRVQVLVVRFFTDCVKLL